MDLTAVTTLTPIPEGFEPYKTLAIEERLAQVERDMEARMDCLEGRVDYVIATLQQLRRAAFKRKAKSL